MSEGDEAGRRRSVANEYRKKLLHYKELDSRIRTGTLHGGISLSTYAILSFLSYQIIALFLHLQLAVSVVIPSSNCYALDNSSRLVDFTDWIGHVFEYEGKDADLVVRFCKDVESRSQAGYVDFGRYATFHHFVAGLGSVDFVQGFYNGDLINCEYTFDKMGRTAKVDIICGNCSNRACKGELGCICSVTYDKTMCRVLVELAIPCVKHGSRVFKGFTVGFHPRSWEVVYNGMTQLGFEKPYHEFSFGTEQTHVSLYLTAVSALSGLVRKPVFKVYPDKGLEVRLSGPAASGSAPTTLSPTILNIDWRCEIARDTPYEINISIPVEDYDPIEFTLTKLCVDSFLNFSSPEKRILWNVPEVIQSAIADYKQGIEGEATRGWATFGVLCCIFIVLLSIFCCGGFIYKTRIEHQHGLDALPGMTLLSACLEAVSGPRGYRLGEDVNDNFINQASWERASGSAQGTQRTVERRYGSI